MHAETQGTIRIAEESLDRITGAIARKARDPIAATAPKLAVCSVSLYRTLVGVGRALVVRTETLVWTERLNFLGGGGFSAFNLTAERLGVAQLRFGFAVELAARRTDYPSRETDAIRPIRPRPETLRAQAPRKVSWTHQTAAETGSPRTGYRNVGLFPTRGNIRICTDFLVADAVRRNGLRP